MNLLLTDSKRSLAWKLGLPAVFLPGKCANLEQVLAPFSEVTFPQSLEHYFRMANSQRIILRYTQIAASFKACTINFCITVRTRNFTVNSVTIIRFPYINFFLGGFF